MSSSTSCGEPCVRQSLVPALLSWSFPTRSFRLVGGFLVSRFSGGILASSSLSVRQSLARAVLSSSFPTSSFRSVGGFLVLVSPAVFLRSLDCVFVNRLLGQFYLRVFRRVLFGRSAVSRFLGFYSGILASS